MRKKNNYDLYLRYVETERILESKEGDHNYEKSFVPLSLHINKPEKGIFDRIAVDFDPSDEKVVWLVVVRYRDGSSFGFTEGQWSVKGAFLSSSDAYALKEQIENDAVPSEMHCEWKSYFATLTDVTIHRMPLDP